MNTINPQGAVKPLSLYVSGVGYRTTTTVSLVNTSGQEFLADYIEVIPAALTSVVIERACLFTVGVFTEGYLADHDLEPALDIVSGLGGWMGTSFNPVTISVPGINISTLTITNWNTDALTASYIINYGIKFLEHSMKNRQTDNIGN